MSINNRYKNRFFIDDIQVFIEYTKTMSKKYERLEKRVFHRESLTGVFTALRNAFSNVIDVVLDHVFSFRIDRWNGTTYDSGYVTGSFHKTDNEYDEDREISKINVTTTDRYEKILKSLDKEYDLVNDLKPEINTVNYYKQPMLQIAFPETEILFNLIGNTSWLLQIPPYNGTELEGFGFAALNNVFVYIPGTNDMSPDVSGIYEQIAPNAYLRFDGVYKIQKITLTRFGIVEVAPNNVVYRMPDLEEFTVERTPFVHTQVFTSLSTSDQCIAFPFNGYQRLLTDADDMAGTPTIPLPEHDIADIVFAYDYYVDPTPYGDLYATVFPRDTHSNVPDAYGKYDTDALHFSGEYFVLDQNLASIIHPVMQKQWREYLLLMWRTAGQMAIMELATVKRQCKDAYELGAVIKAMLGKIDTDIAFESNALHSQFLYKTINPLTSVEYGFTHLITPKSNIIIGDYDNPARKGIITFGDIEQLLLAANLFWYINANGHFIIEHINYFKKGRSYTIDIVSNDLTVQIEPKNQKQWAYRTKKYSYKKETLPERIDFSWMDIVSELFTGYPILIRSAFVEKGNIDTIAVSKFTSDFDYGQAFPENLSKDGFYIMACTGDVDTYTVQFEDLDVPGIPLDKVQNGFWSFPFLHETFHRYNLPAPDVTINNLDTTATTVRRAKVQEIVYPSPLEPDPMRLVRTSLGLAEIESMDVNLTTRTATLKVLLDLDV